MLRESPLQLTHSTVSVGEAPGRGYAEITGAGDSVIADNEFAAGRIDIGNSNGASIIRANRFTVGELSFSNSSSENQLIEDNRLDVTSLNFWSGRTNFSDNHVNLSGALTVMASDTLTVTDNVFEVAAPAVTSDTFSFTPNAGSLDIQFHGNASSGTSRLFHFTQSGGTFRLTAEMTGNTFDADLQAVGDVALLSNMNQPGAVVTSDNTWGTLATAQQVLDLIEYSSSTVGALTVAEF